MSATESATTTRTDEALARALARPGFLDRTWVPPVFLLATIGTVFLVGIQHAIEFYVVIMGQTYSWTDPAVLTHAGIYTGALLTILGAHEMGHWLVSRREGVRTSLPVFIPMPIGLGTFGAVISMNELPPTRAALIRIGAAGPLAGGAVALVLMAAALRTCLMIPDGSDPTAPVGMGLHLGDSLGTILIANAMHLTVPPGMVPFATPFLLATWTGFLLTSINLLPVGQLDGGHIFYGIIGERANRFARPFALCVIALSIPASWGAIVAPTYLVWGLVVLALVSWHPPIPRPEEKLPLDAKLLVIACLILFALTFMISPIRVVG